MSDDAWSRGLRDELQDWWLNQASIEIEATVPKATEYGSASDLEAIGHDLARVAGRTVSDAEAAELGVMFYVRGKMQRWIAAAAAGRQVSDDTLFDIGVYIKMAQRIRSAGAWPRKEINE